MAEIDPLLGSKHMKRGKGQLQTFYEFKMHIRFWKQHFQICSGRLYRRLLLQKFQYSISFCWSRYERTNIEKIEHWVTKQSFICILKPLNLKQYEQVIKFWQRFILPFLWNLLRNSLQKRKMTFLQTLRHLISFW